MKFLRGLVRFLLILLFLAIPAAITTAVAMYSHSTAGALLTILVYAPFFYLIHLVFIGRIGPKPTTRAKADESLPLTPDMLAWSAAHSGGADALDALPPEEPVQPSVLAGPELVGKHTDPPDGENAVDLLSRILSEQEQKNAAHAAPAPARRPSRLPVVLLSLGCAALASGLITVSVLWQRQASADAASISDLNAQLEEASFSLRATESRLTVAQRASESRLELWQSAQDELDKITPEYEFYHQRACIVTDAGAKYHRYGCGALNYDQFWIYNIENARYLGYEPCSHCNPGQVVLPDGTILDLYD